MRSLRRRAVIAVIAAAWIASMVWAVTVVITPSRSDAPAAPALVTVIEGHVGESLSLNATADVDSAVVGVNEAVGVVLQVAVHDGQSLEPGAHLYNVDGRWSSIARGARPAYRPLVRGDTGADVEQLQRLLIDRGYYRGAPDGSFGSATELAVAKWQRAQGNDAVGAVRLGDLVFVEQLPARIRIDAALVARGSHLTGGERAILGQLEPRFSISASRIQADQMTAGTSVILTGVDGQRWNARAGSKSAHTGDQSVDVALDSASASEPICGSRCGSVPAGRSMFAAQIITRPEVSGPMLPATAVVTSASGRSSVVDARGRRHPVTIAASADGMVVVRGVAPGLRVRLGDGARGDGARRG